MQQVGHGDCGCCKRWNEAMVENTDAKETENVLLVGLGQLCITCSLSGMGRVHPLHTVNPTNSICGCANVDLDILA